MSDLIMLFLEQKDLLGEALEFIEDCDSYSPYSQLELEERIRMALAKDLHVNGNELVAGPSNSEE